MSHRRQFIKKVLAGSGLLALSPMEAAGALSDTLIRMNRVPLNEAVEDDGYWWSIRQAYRNSSGLINLNNGGVSPQPEIVSDALKRYYDESNEVPSYYMWRILHKDKEAVRKKLALFGGADAGEIAINRNTTEALDTVIFGIDLQKGDEVVLSDFDYPNMMNAWKMREKRHGIRLHWVSLPLPVEHDDEVVKRYLDAITPRTKVLHLTHVVNWTGQVIPVKRICSEAKKRGVFCIVDGAHSFAHLNFTISDLEADVFGTSLHKWLGAPFGTGMLWIKKEHISKIWPMFPDDDPQRSDIRKFENLGTRMEPSEIAIGQAVDFNAAIGKDRKEKRLRFLTSYWLEKVRGLPGLKVNIPKNPQMSGALAHIEIEGSSGAEIERYLLKNYRVHTSPVKHLHIDGIRVSPNIYTTTNDLDVLAEGLEAFVRDR